jgi:predicted DNA-binding transcriptional regulator AlpA
MTLDGAPELLLPREVMTILRIGKNSFYGMADELGAIRLGPRQIRVPKHALRAWLEASARPLASGSQGD